MIPFLQDVVNKDSCNDSLFYQLDAQIFILIHLLHFSTFILILNNLMH